jgi:hypothetical protein
MGRSVVITRGRRVAREIERVVVFEGGGRTTMNVCVGRGSCQVSAILADGL